MGRPSDPARALSDDAVSLHTQRTQQGQTGSFLDDDAPELQVDDLPPMYDEIAAPVDGDSSSAPLIPRPEVSGHFPGMLPFFRKDATTGDEVYMAHSFDDHPKVLEQHVEWWSQSPPRPFVRLHGTHSQHVENNGKKERKTVTDFDVQVELTPYLYSDAVNRVAFREIRTAENSDKVHRGTVFAKRADGVSQSIEVGLPAKPTLEEWCHRYHASHAGLKCFAVKRRMVGFDQEKVRQKLDSLVRSTKYRGHLDITFPVKDQYVRVYNDTKVNRWRFTTWIVWLCVFTCMFLFTWPYLFFRTKRFEVVSVDWAYSLLGEDGRKKYVSVNEDQWYNLWGRAINRAVLEKRQAVLDQQDLITSEGAQPVFGNVAVDNAVGFLRAGVSAMNEVNRQFGWGGDC